MKKIYYPKAECQRVIAAVIHLSAILSRPVCSKDLEEYFRGNPEMRPALLQGLGQQLIKTARPAAGVIRICRIGLIGNRAFYAPSLETCWFDRLECHRAELALAHAVRENLPEAVKILLGGQEEPLAKNAIAGWRLETESQVLRITDPKLIKSTTRMLEAAKPWAASTFAGNGLTDLIGRSKAVALLKEELSKRAAFKLEAGVNTDRILVGWSWPQSTLFTSPSGPLAYSRSQLGLLAASLWPESHENEAFSHAMLLSLKYGLP
jgi:hypothetical protein